jgi:hypothetical protein
LRSTPWQPQRLAGGAFAQHAVATGAAFEVNLRRLAELGRCHHRITGLAAGNLDLKLT